MIQTIYLDFGALGEECLVQVELEWVDAEVPAYEAGKPMWEGNDAGYTVASVTWELEGRTNDLTNRYFSSDFFASKVNESLRDEGVEI